MKLVKDLLYGKGNVSLDIARLSSAFSILCFWGAVLWTQYNGKDFDAMAVGGGCAAIMAGAAGWIYARQKQEVSDGQSTSA